MSDSTTIQVPVDEDGAICSLADLQTALIQLLGIAHIDWSDEQLYDTYVAAVRATSPSGATTLPRWAEAEIASLVPKPARKQPCSHCAAGAPLSDCYPGMHQVGPARFAWLEPCQTLASAAKPVTIHLLLLRDRDGRYSDIVALSDQARVQELQCELAARFGPHAVSVLALALEAEPEYWGHTRTEA